MHTNKINVQIVDSPDDAPKYDKETPLLEMTTMIIVGEGTIDGKPSVDIQLSDMHGNKYVIMATGGIIEMMGSAVKGKRERDSTEGIK